LPYESNLSKSLSDYKCWELATIYSDPNYSGSSHTFTASTTTHGWYHRIIYDLDETDQGCGDNYSGNFDNSFSSHRWQDDYYSPQYRICRPVALHAFDKTNRDQSGDHYKWEELDSHYTGFDSSEPLGDSCHQLNQEASWSYRSMNDKASSLDMFFRVFTPGDCI
jgi:hypothetical protein